MSCNTHTHMHLFTHNTYGHTSLHAYTHTCLTAEREAYIGTWRLETQSKIQISIEQQQKKLKDRMGWLVVRLAYPHAKSLGLQAVSFPYFLSSYHHRNSGIIPPLQCLAHLGCFGVS